jgi:hypothetical protein
VLIFIGTRDLIIDIKDSIIVDIRESVQEEEEALIGAEDTESIKASRPLRTDEVNLIKDDMPEGP